MSGYTHLQRAQPITFAHHIMAYASMLCRDLDRLRDVKRRMNVCPLGSGALAGTTYPLNREMTAELLGFDGVTLNSLDGVSDRDFCIELAGALSIIMVHLSRFSEEIIMWCIEVGLPVTLEELGAGNVTDEQLMEVAKAASAEGDTLQNMPFTVTPESVFAAIKAADAYGRYYLGEE